MEYARNILRALGVPAADRTVIMTDNKANELVANDPGASSRSKHFLRRYFVLRQRIAAGVAKIVKVPDPQMPADFLTKWLPAKKFNLSLDYATNASAARASSKDA